VDDSIIEVDVQLEIQAILNLLVANPSFINEVRLALSKDVRAYGNTLGKWAQREPRPKAIQPNTVQRIFS
jgi:hypothetical protein